MRNKWLKYVWECFSKINELKVSKFVFTKQPILKTNSKNSVFFLSKVYQTCFWVQKLFLRVIFKHDVKFVDVFWVTLLKVLNMR